MYADTHKRHDAGSDVDEFEARRQNLCGATIEKGLHRGQECTKQKRNAEEGQDRQPCKTCSVREKLQEYQTAFLLKGGGGNEITKRQKSKLKKERQSESRT